MKLGEASQISMGVKDLEVSVSFYQKLGFRVLARGTSPYPWAQVTDDMVLLLLNQDGLDYIGLLYFSSAFSRTIDDLRSMGINFVHESKENGRARQVMFSSPDQFFIGLVNHNGEDMYQPSGKSLAALDEKDQKDTSKYANARLGVFGELCHRVSDFRLSRKFWESIGFECTYSSAEPYQWGIFRHGWQVVGLHQSNEFGAPALTYFAADSAKKVKQLRKEGVEHISAFGGDVDDNVVITSPDNHKVFLFKL